MKITNTIIGTFDTSLSVNISDISLPEFINGRTVDGVEASLFYSHRCQYNIIFRCDFLHKTNMKFYFKQNIVDWMGASITMKPVIHYNMLANIEDIGLQLEDSLFISYINLILDQEEDELFEDEKMLLEQNYTKVKPSKVVDKQNHLSATEKNKLQETLDLDPKLFDEKLGQAHDYKFKIELKPGITPSFQRQFPILYR